ncbi:MAG: hypothetical protein HY840_02830 [Bacteroidetes bacterium]|nr:hypothetical protein [Bacteroidota bacterium]
MKTLGNKEKEDFTLKEKLLYAGGTVVVTLGTFFLGRKIIRGAVSNSEEKRTFDENSPATYAKRIKMAFDNDGWFGTNTPELRKILIEIPSKKAMTQVSNSYQKLYHSPLYKDMADELQSTEYNEMLAIVNAKPDRIEKRKKGNAPNKPTATQYEDWAKRMKAAFDKSYGPFPGTDEDAVKAVFTEMPTQDAFVETAKAYFKLYNSNMLDDLKSEMDDWQDYMKIITSKPQK